MRLFLAVAVLMLAFVAYTEAQDDTVQEKFANFGKQLSEMSLGLAEKAKTAFEEIHQSQFATETRSWFDQLIEKAKSTISEMAQ
ncbi:apolipoprotein C-I [Lates calcarifer]|uniref:Apolipoprotein C-I n=1 Tax=Lates calcarifer TaxID=8187 RepID=A0A4W6DAT6_LATCA|nr:apolipoprotein C-I [Lates calcarifer]XP_050931945.1 apolipoprotein C-I [Lates calcarifer]